MQWLIYSRDTVVQSCSQASMFWSKSPNTVRFRGWRRHSIEWSTHTSLTSSVGWFVVLFKHKLFIGNFILKNPSKQLQHFNWEWTQTSMWSCRPVSLKSLKLLTRPCFYVLETSALSKCDHIRVSGILSWNWRQGRMNRG